MSYLLDGLTSNLVNKALDIAWAQHLVHVHNISNANVKGYQSQHVDFSQVLSEISKVIDSGAPEQFTQKLINSIDTNLVDIQSTGEAVKLDKEMVALTQTDLHFQALLTAKSKFGDLTKMAIKGGRS